MQLTKNVRDFVINWDYIRFMNTRIIYIEGWSDFLKKNVKKIVVIELYTPFDVMLEIRITLKPIMWYFHSFLLWTKSVHKDHVFQRWCRITCHIFFTRKAHCCAKFYSTHMHDTVCIKILLPESCEGNHRRMVWICTTKTDYILK